MLCSLAEKHRSDKCPRVFHSYTPAYEKILADTRLDAKLVVEIGIGFPELMRPIVGDSYRPGASLRMWRDYFPNAQVVGCDIRRDVLFQEDRIQCRLVDQSSRESLLALKTALISHHGAADMILDDGSHEPAHMVLSFQMLWGAVRPGGFYIIEDVRREHLADFMKLHTFFADCELKYIHHGEGHWDSFVCFKKRTPIV